MKFDWAQLECSMGDIETYKKLTYSSETTQCLILFRVTSNANMEWVFLKQRT